MSGFHLTAAPTRVLLLCLLFWVSGGSFAQATPESNETRVPVPTNQPGDGLMTQKPEVEELGGDRFKIGAITVDRGQRLISVPGWMIPYEAGKPIEFLATMKQGYKAYESVLELDANAFEFNLACILIGLDAEQSSTVEYHFDPRPVEGNRVALQVIWKNRGKRHKRNAVDLLKVGESKPDSPATWVYTGSLFSEENRYLAHVDGVIVGLVHDPASIIEHREGIGLNDWGSIAIDTETAPAGGQEILLEVRGLD